MFEMGCLDGSHSQMHDLFLRTQAVYSKPNRCAPVDNDGDVNSYDSDKVVSDVSFLLVFKPENLLYNLDENGREVLKIADFGLSKMLYGEENTSTVCGTPGYCGKVSLHVLLYNPLFGHGPWYFYIIHCTNTLYKHFFKHVSCYPSSDCPSEQGLCQ